MNKECETLRKSLYTASGMICDIHKIISLINKFCETHKDDDSLYEVSYAIKIAEEKINQLGYYIYKINNSDTHPKSFNAALKNLKKAIKKNEIKLIDD